MKIPWQTSEIPDGSSGSSVFYWSSCSALGISENNHCLNDGKQTFPNFNFYVLLKHLENMFRTAKELPVSLKEIGALLVDCTSQQGSDWTRWLLCSVWKCSQVCFVRQIQDMFYLLHYNKFAVRGIWDTQWWCLAFAWDEMANCGAAQVVSSLLSPGRDDTLLPSFLPVVCTITVLPSNGCISCA